jgi:hypothetical protein
MTSLQQEILKRTSAYKSFTPIEDVYYYDDSAFFEKCPLCSSEKGDSKFIYINKLRFSSEAQIYCRVTVRFCHDCLRLVLHKYYRHFKEFPKLRRAGMNFHCLATNFDKKELETSVGYPSFPVPKEYLCDYYSTYGDGFPKQT